MTDVIDNATIIKEQGGVISKLKTDVEELKAAINKSSGIIQVLSSKVEELEKKVNQQNEEADGATEEAKETKEAKGAKEAGKSCTKWCLSVIFDNECRNGEHCSFAHTEADFGDNPIPEKTKPEHGGRGGRGGHISPMPQIIQMPQMTPEMMQHFMMQNPTFFADAMRPPSH